MLAIHKSNRDSNNSIDTKYVRFETFGANENNPYLYIDVNINNEELHTIPVYEGDTPEYLSCKFSKDQKLDKVTEDKLLILIQAQMKSVLCKIEEVENEVTDNSSQLSR